MLVGHAVRGGGLPPICSKRAAMFEVAEDADRIGDDLMRLLALDVGDEADAAGILFQRGIVQAFSLRPERVFFDCLRKVSRFRGCDRQPRGYDVFALEFRPAQSLRPLNQ